MEFVANEDRHGHTGSGRGGTVLGVGGRDVCAAERAVQEGDGQLPFACVRQLLQ